MVAVTGAQIIQRKIYLPKLVLEEPQCISAKPMKLTKLTSKQGPVESRSFVAAIYIIRSVLEKLL